MIYHVELSDSARKTLKKMDRNTAGYITKWLRKNLEGCSDPRIRGKALTGDLRGAWRYRVGDYRIIAKIQDDKVVILVLEIGHRREIYKK